MGERVLRVLMGCLAALVLLPPAGHAATIGLADNDPATFGHPIVRSLGLKDARLIVGWDAAAREPATVDAWLAAVTAAGLEPQVAFQHRRGEDCSVRGRGCTLPTAAQFGDAFAAFHARWPQVTTFTTWNEANHVAQPTAARPGMVAAFYREIVARCPGCTVVAGDVLDSGPYVAWLRAFIAASPVVPQLWGLHNYADVTYGGTKGTDAVLATVPGTLWIEETGGIVENRAPGGFPLLRPDEARAARAITAAFTIAAARPRIARVNFYQWRARPTDGFDAGMLRPDGTPRPSLSAFVAGVMGSVTSASIGERVYAPAKRLRVTWRARWASKARRAIVLRAACGPPSATCSGRVRATLRVVWRAGARRHSAVWTLRPFKLKGAAVRIALPRGAAADLRGARFVRARLRMAVTLAGETRTRRPVLGVAAR